MCLKLAPERSLWAFFIAAKRALKPGGRLVLVQDKALIDHCSEIAQAVGMGFHSIEISDEKAGKSPARFIRKRATPARRAVRMRLYAREQPESFFLTLSRLQSKQALKTPDEYARPTLMFFRKLRKGEQRKLLTVSINTTGLFLSC